MNEEKLTAENMIRIKNEIIERLDKLFFAKETMAYCYTWYDAIAIVLKRYFPDQGPVTIFETAFTGGATIQRYDDKIHIYGCHADHYSNPSVILDKDGVFFSEEYSAGETKVYITRDFTEEEREDI